jgi:hypothetical protein
MNSKGLRPQISRRMLISKVIQDLLEIPAKDRSFAGDPPEDIHFRCGRCFREGRLTKADMFSYTPLMQDGFRGWPPKAQSQSHFLEGRCYDCAKWFKGRLVEYDLGRRILWAKFCREVSSQVMDS